MKKGLCIFLLFIISIPVFSQIRSNSNRVQLQPRVSPPNSVSLQLYNDVFGRGLEATWSRVEEATGYEVTLYYQELRNGEWGYEFTLARITKNIHNTTSHRFQDVNLNPELRTGYFIKVKTLKSGSSSIEGISNILFFGGPSTSSSNSSSGGLRLNNNSSSSSSSSDTPRLRPREDSSSSSSSSGGPRLNNSSSRNPFLGTWEGTYGNKTYKYEFSANTVTVTVRLGRLSPAPNTYSCTYRGNDNVIWTSDTRHNFAFFYFDENKIRVNAEVDCYKQ